jgi:lipopolysaccharide/colanic/teichoic acid biosynthesis glycosyltransferase
MIDTKVLPIPLPNFPSVRSPLRGNEVGLRPACSIVQCRQNKLLVTCASSGTPSRHRKSIGDTELPALLHRAELRAICLDPKLGETELRWWAQLGDEVGIPTFVRLPSTPHLPQKQHLWRWQLKRAIDLTLAIVLLLLLSPVMLMVIVLMQIDSPGAIFFQQWRIGERGKLFRIIKFRTMTVDAENLHHQVMANQSGLHKLEDDPRVTRFGRWMRKYSLDEIPQLINVLCGEMSLVGPRPWAMYDALRIDPQGQRRLNALPGITGAWQVSRRSNLRDLAQVNGIDLDYLRHWSFGQDFKILLRTIPKVFAGTGAY